MALKTFVWPLLLSGHASVVCALHGYAPATAETDGNEAVIPVATPTLTQSLDDELKRRARDSKLCGFVNGEAGTPLYCNREGEECKTVDTAPFIGCASTWVFTTCYDYTSWLYDSENNIPVDSRTGYCQDSLVPSCSTWTYTSGTYEGYSMIRCVTSHDSSAFLAWEPTAAVTGLISTSTVIFQGPQTQPSSSTTPTPTPTPTNDSGPLSRSDKIALGVGIGVGLPATIAALITLCYTCRRG